MLERRGDGPSLADIMGRRELAGRRGGAAVPARVAPQGPARRRGPVGHKMAALSIGGLWPTGSRASTKVRVGNARRSDRGEPRPADRRRVPGLRSGSPRVRDAARSESADLPARQRRDRRRQPAQRPRAVADLSHLGCRPNPCIEDFWLHCPCHQSRYDRLGTKIAGEQYGPAPRSMDRFPIEVDEHGVLTIDTREVIRGPAPKALGEPGVIPPRVTGGCA